ncbi:MAG: hypothetical protein IJ583_11590 [Firmicutes bacterium]|nr:hypothetical protein [Bacillota bacterium]
MEDVDNRFFEEYKWLNKICSEIFSCNNGVSEYISEMEKENSFFKYKLSTWDIDYKELKHLRRIRNKIAHDVTGVQFSKEEDIESVKKFYERIINGDDPLTQIRKAEEAARKNLSHTKKYDDNEPKNEKITNTNYLDNKVKQTNISYHENKLSRRDWFHVIIISFCIIIGIIIVSFYIVELFF